MSNQLDAYFEKQHQYQQQSNNPMAASSASEPPEIPKTDSSTNPVTAAEYIYNSMNPSSISPLEDLEVVGLGVVLGKRKRCNTGDSSNFSGSIRSMGSLRPEAMNFAPLSSMDLFLRSEDVELGNGRIQSADIIRDLLETNQPSLAGIGNPSSRLEHKHVNSPLKSKRLSTGEIRISSSDWVQDFRDESVDLGPMHPSLFMHFASHADVAAHLNATPPLNSSTYLYPELAKKITKPKEKRMTPLPNTINILPATATKPKKKRRKPRALGDVAEPTDNDVLFGRGGFANIHPGNIRFRQKALELRPVYEESSKDEKQRIAEVLVKFVKNEGHRFLEKKEGLWHEVIGNGAHKKASQALRERIKRKKSN